MKKLVSLLLCLLLTFAVACPALAEANVTIEPVLLAVFSDMTVADWYTEDAARVLLATSVMLDITIGDDQALTDLVVNAVANDRTYVAKNAGGDSLTIYFFAENEMLLVLYNPTTGNIVAGTTAISASMAPTAMENVLAEGSVESYYQIAGDDIMIMLDVIMETISE